MTPSKLLVHDVADAVVAAVDDVAADAAANLKVIAAAEFHFSGRRRKID